jgi:hypothetical protein
MMVVNGLTGCMSFVSHANSLDQVQIFSVLQQTPLIGLSHYITTLEENEPLAKQILSAPKDLRLFAQR